VTGPPPTPHELMRAIRMSSIAGLFGIAAVTIALIVFVTQARAERDRMCDVISEVMIGNANALIVATEPDKNNPEFTPEDAARREKIVKSYMDQLVTTLEGC